jgi:hypothetical protein
MREQLVNRPRGGSCGRQPGGRQKGSQETKGVGSGSGVLIRRMRTLSLSLSKRTVRVAKLITLLSGGLALWTKCRPSGPATVGQQGIGWVINY